MGIDILKKKEYWIGFASGIMAFEIIKSLMAIGILIAIYIFGGFS